MNISGNRFIDCNLHSMKRLPEIFIFLLSFAYTDSLDTDVSHVIVDHKGNSIIAIVDSMDLNTVYYTNKSDNKVSTIDIDKVYFIYNDFDRVYHYDWSYYENLRRITNRTGEIITLDNDSINSVSYTHLTLPTTLQV